MKGEFYSSGSLKTIRYGLNRASQDFGHLFEITGKKTASFTGSNKAFNLTLKEIKKAYKGHQKSTSEITLAHKVCTKMNLCKL